MELKRIYDIMLRYEERHPDQKIALSGKIGKNKWNEYTPKQYKKTADELSCALLAKGIARGDKVAVISTNRPEWTITQDRCGVGADLSDHHGRGLQIHPEPL